MISNRMFVFFVGILWSIVILSMICDLLENGGWRMEDGGFVTWWVHLHAERQSLGGLATGIQTMHELISLRDSRRPQRGVRFSLMTWRVIGRGKKPGSEMCQKCLEK